MRRVLSLFLALIMIVCLFASCGGTDDSGSNSTTNTNDGGSIIAADTDYVYLPDYMILPTEVTEMSQARLINGVVYFFANEVIGTRTTLVSDTNVFSWTVPTYNEDGSIPDGYHEAEVDVTEQMLYRINPDGSGYAKVEGFGHPEIPDTAMAGTQWTVSQMLPAGEDAVWVSQTGYFGYTNESNQYIDDTRTLIRKVSLTTGQDLATLDSSAMTASNPYFAITYFESDAGGNLYIAGYDGVTFVFSPEGTALGSVAVPQGSYMQNLIAMPDGNVAMMYGEFGGATHTKPIDPNTRTLGTEYAEINIGTSSAFGVGFGMYGATSTSGFAGEVGDGKSLLYYDQTALYSVTPGEERKELINWVDSDVDPSGIKVLGSLDDTHVLCLSVVGGTNSSMMMWGFGTSSGPVMIDLISLEKTPASEVPQKTVLTLAVNSIDQTLRAEVLRFNKRDANYRIKIVDYSVYNTTSDYTAGATKLNTEIISGNIPDMILLSQLPSSNYISKGLLEDLYPYLDADSELGGRSAVLPAYLNALETDGKLYQISSGFSITTFSGDSRRIGEGDGWSMDDLNEAIKNNPQMTSLFPYDFDRNTAISLILSFNLPEYVNKTTGECNFNTPEFVKLLEFIKTTFPETVDYTNMTYTDPNDALLNGTSLIQFSMLMNLDSFMNVYALFQGNVAFKGMPCETEKGNAFTANLPLAMSSKCADKEGAWSFMRGILTESFQSDTSISYSFPSNAKLFEQNAKDAMIENTEQGYFSGGGKDTDGDGVNDIYPKGQIGGYMPGSQAIYYYALTQSEYNRFMDYINSIERISETDSTLTEIVTEELGPFFANQKTAEDTASIIQNRASIYVNEQR